jgi:hypothetical protein
MPSLLMLALCINFSGCDNLPPPGSSESKSSAALQSVSDVTVTARTPEEVHQAARVGLSEMLARIPAGAELSWGFSSREELSRAEIGRPIRVIHGAVDASRTVLQPVDLYRVPVIVDGHAVCLMTMSKNDRGEWIAVDLGGAGLARAIDDGNANAEVSLVRFHALKMDFFMSEKNGQVRFRGFYADGAAAGTRLPEALSRSQLDEVVRNRAVRMGLVKGGDQ